MSYQVIARKYRPQSFEEIVGQPVVTKTLRNAIASGRVAHAFLFSGVRGVGKTTMARILAKCLNCHQGTSPTPCGECPSCLEIAESRSMDVQEIDAASNTGVDNIRELRESVQYGTSRDRFKIFIIDEAHMLSNAAFNALLKTLEEPPPHVKFVLATTEQHKIPVTISSRCQHFEFKPIQFAEILRQLHNVCEAEGAKVSEYALRLIASEGRGSMRDAQSALDQALSLGGKEIGDQEVRSLLGAVDDRLVLDVSGAVFDQDRRKLVELMESVLEAGVEAEHFCQEVIVHLRNLLVCKIAGWDERLLHLPDTFQEEVQAQSERISSLELIRAYDLLSRTRNELKWLSHPHVHLEITLMKLIELSGLAPIEEVIGRLESGGPGAVPPASGKPRAEPQSAPGLRRPVQPRRPADEETPPWEELQEVREAEEISPAAEAPAETKANSSPATPEPASDVEVRLLERIQREDMGLYAFLPDRDHIRLSEGTLEIQFESGDAFQKSMVEKPAHLKVLERVCAELTGGPTRVSLSIREARTSPSKAQRDPGQDPKVKTFLESFPGKYVIEKNVED